MAFKIYRENNYIVVEDTTADKEFRGHISKALFYKDKTSEEIYNTDGFYPQGLQGIAVSDMIDETDTPFVDEQAFIDFYTDNTGNFNGGGASPLIENTAEFIQSSAIGDFRKAHGTVQVGNKFFVGCRQQDIVVAYNNLNNLKDTTIITIPDLSGLQGVESMCYDDVNDKVYFPISETNKIVVLNNLDDITDFTVYAIDDLGGLVFSGSSPIMTDGDSIYICSETQDNPTLFKIQISDFTIVDTLVMNFGNGRGAHAGCSSPNKQFGYFINGGANGHIAKVNLSTMTFINSQTHGLNSATDDCAYVTGYGVDSVIVLSEFPENDNKNAVMIKTSDLSINKRLDVLPAFSVIFNEILGILYFASVDLTTKSGNDLDGFIELLDLNKLTDSYTDKNITELYPTRGIQPNELALIIDETGLNGGDRIFATNWTGDFTTSNFHEIKLTPVQATTLTKAEFLNRYYQPVYQAQYFVLQDFSGFSYVEELNNTIGIDFTFEYFDFGKLNCPEFDKDTMYITSIQVDVGAYPVGQIIFNSSTAGANLWSLEADGVTFNEEIGTNGLILTITKYK